MMMERVKWKGRYTRAQNGLFWCVHNEKLRNAAYSFPILASYSLITTGRYFKNEIGIANFTKC
jgi:hypothetical protein